jgi:hypothetical protein
VIGHDFERYGLRAQVFGFGDEQLAQIALDRADQDFPAAASASHRRIPLGFSRGSASTTFNTVARAPLFSYSKGHGSPLHHRD